MNATIKDICERLDRMEPYDLDIEIKKVRNGFLVKALGGEIVFETTISLLRWLESAYIGEIK